MKTIHAKIESQDIIILPHEQNEEATLDWQHIVDKLIMLGIPAFVYRDKYIRVKNGYLLMAHNKHEDAFYFTWSEQKILDVPPDLVLNKLLPEVKKYFEEQL